MEALMWSAPKMKVENNIYTCCSTRGGMCVAGSHTSPGQFVASQVLEVWASSARGCYLSGFAEAARAGSTNPDAFGVTKREKEEKTLAWPLVMEERQSGGWRGRLLRTTSVGQLKNY